MRRTPAIMARSVDLPTPSGPIRPIIFRAEIEVMASSATAAIMLRDIFDARKPTPPFSIHHLHLFATAASVDLVAAPVGFQSFWGRDGNST